MNSKYYISLIKQLIIAFMVLTACFALCQASSLTVDPGRHLCILKDTANNDYKGEQVTLKIRNGGKETTTYEISVAAPDQGSGGTGITQGYTAITDTSIIDIITKSIEIPGGKTGKVSLLVKPPSKEEHYNQHWEAAVSVTGSASANVMVRMAAVVRLFVETPSRIAHKIKPAGPIALAPSIQTFNLPEQYSSEVNASNNSDAKISFRAAVIVPPPAVQGQFIPRTPLYEPLSDKKWFTVEPASFELSSGETQNLKIHIKLPENTSIPSGGYEALLLVHGAGQPMIFSRLQVMVPGDDSSSEAHKKGDLKP